MLKLIHSLIVIFAVSMIGYGQGCIHDIDRANLLKKIAENKAALTKSGKLPQTRSMVPPELSWPLRPAKGLNDPSYYYITNYVDINPDTTIVEDYNCGNRSYEGHRGIDIALTPFKWNKVEDSSVEVIAAADGVLLNKHDGEFDRQCSVDAAATWNVVIIEHMDGSQTWYGHLKSGSVTSKNNGDIIKRGEVLGIVASSGKSTGPHLHFEVHDQDGNTLEPFEGSCNQIGGSWWESQLEYYDSGINKVMTSSKAFTDNECPQLTDLYEENAFEQGDSIFFSLHYRHHLNTDTTYAMAIQPDGVTSPFLDEVYTRDGNLHKGAHTHFWSRILPNDAEQGKWKFAANYQSTIYGMLAYEKYFWVKQDCLVDRNLQGTHTSDRYYPVSNSITSSAQISDGRHVVYDASSFTVLSPGFRAESGSRLEVKTDGCN